MRRAVARSTGVEVSPDLLAGGSVRFPFAVADILTDGVPTGVVVALTGLSLSWSRDQLHQSSGGASWSAGVPVDPRVVPRAPGSLILAGVTELRVRIGLTVDGVEVVCQVGIFPISSAAWDGATVSVRLGCRSERISRARLEQPTEWTAATTLTDAVAAMVGAAVPSIGFTAEGSAPAAPAVVHETQTDPWQAATDAATAAGCWLFIGADGQARWMPEPHLDPASLPVATFAAGTNLIDPTVESSMDGFENRTYCTGSAADLTAPIVGVATLTDGASTYRYGGPVGKIPQWITSDMVRTVEDANAAASAAQAVERPAETVRFTAPLHAALELLDPVRIVWPGGWVDQVAFLDQISFDVLADQMECSAVVAEWNTEGT